MKKIILFLFTIASVNIGNAQWVAQTSGTANMLTSIHFPSSTVGYTCQDNGFFLKTTNGGANWNPIGGATTIGGPIQFTSLTTGYGVSADNGVLKTIDGGLTWVDNFFSSDPFESSVALHFPTNTIGYSASINGSFDSILVDKTIDAGNTWFRVCKIPSYGLPSTVFFTTATIGFITAGPDAIYKTINGGISWTPVLVDPSPTTIHFPSASIGYAAGYGKIWKSINGGDTWNLQTTTSTTLWYSIFFTDVNTGYLVGGDGLSGQILKTINGGTTWTSSYVGSFPFNSVYFPIATEGYACGLGGDIHKYTIASEINEPNELNNFSIYPNPTSGMLNISNSDFSNSQPTIISIFDLIGNLIYSNSMETENMNVDLSNFSKGIYVLKIENENGSRIEKIVLQ